MLFSPDEDQMSVDENGGEDDEEGVLLDSDGKSEYFDAEDNETGSNKVVTFENEPRVSPIPGTKPRTAEEKIKAARTEFLFPDEVEAPYDVSARKRFAKYRGLPSFSKCIWPTENDTSLPYEYSKIFRCEVSLTFHLLMIYK